MTFTVALAQCTHPEDGDVVALCRRWCQQAVNANAQLLVFPESLMTRYEAERGAFLRAAEPIDGPFCTAMDALAREFGLWVVYTVNEQSSPHGDTRPYNTAVLTNDQGKRQGAYRKVHLFDSATTQESDRMSAGSTLMAPVDTPFGRVGLGICYDLRFPEVARHAALQGCNLMVYPAAWVDGPGKAAQWKTLLAARALENEMYVLGCCRADAGYIGHSCVMAPDGTCVAEAGAGPELVVATLDSTAISRMRQAIPVLEHRVPKAYR